jgi:hypothetical protein
MQQSPHKDSAFGSALAFPNRHDFELTQRPFELDAVGAFGCILSVCCPSLNNAILPINN